MIVDMHACPPELKKSLRAYVEGRPTGGFLRAVLENNLQKAVLRADAENLRLIPEIVAFVFDEVPTFARGSEKAVTAHLDKCSAAREHESKCDIDLHRCTSPRWIGQYSVPGRCGHCYECGLWHRAKRLSRLQDGLSNWARIEILKCTDRPAYRALVKQLERMRKRTGEDLAHVSIPYPDGARLVLTEAEIGGEALDTAPATLKERLEAFLLGARDEKKARLDGSKNWAKKEAGGRPGW